MGKLKRLRKERQRRKKEAGKEVKPIKVKKETKKTKIEKVWGDFKISSSEKMFLLSFQGNENIYLVYFTDNRIPEEGDILTIPEEGIWKVGHTTVWEKMITIRERGIIGVVDRDDAQKAFKISFVTDALIEEKRLESGNSYFQAFPSNGYCANFGEIEEDYHRFIRIWFKAKLTRCDNGTIKVEMMSSDKWGCERHCF